MIPAGYTVWLEEDHYVAPDILHVLAMMRREKTGKVGLAVHCAWIQPTSQELTLPCAGGYPEHRDISEEV